MGHPLTTLATVVICMVAAVAVAPAARSEPLSNPAPYAVRRASAPLTIDGRLDEPAWKNAAKIDQFKLFRPVDVPRLPATSARLLWDDDHLYVGFECQDDDIWSYSATDDAPIYLGDVAELFIKPRQDSLAYYEFVFAPSGAIYDARYTSRGAGLSHRYGDWNSRAKIAVTRDGTDDNDTDDDRGYVVEVAIPLQAFADSERPAKDVDWKFGVFRYDYSKSYSDPLMLMTLPSASRQHGFHDYDKYGPLRFEN